MSLEAELKKREEMRAELLGNIKGQLPKLEELLKEVSSHWHGEDGFYRFYHQSFKVYRLQRDTERVVAVLRGLLPGRELNGWFAQIIREGTGKVFEIEHNARWLAETRPMLEAFFHARTMLELVVRHGKELEAPPQVLPSGWAAVLYLYICVDSATAAPRAARRRSRCATAPHGAIRVARFLAETGKRRTNQ